jgi:hypothetical protein
MGSKLAEETLPRLMVSYFSNLFIELMFFVNILIDFSFFIVVDLKQNKISNDAAGVKIDCTILIKDEDFIGLAKGTSNPQQVSFLLILNQKAYSLSKM